MSFWRPRRRPPPPPVPEAPAEPLGEVGLEGGKRYRLAVCKGSDCRRGGSEALYQRAREAVGTTALSERCVVLRGGCYGLCHLGPNVVVREDTGRPKDPFSPEDYQLMGWDGEVHYGAMTLPKLERVLREHLGADRPVDELTAKAHQVLPPGER